MAHTTLSTPTILVIADDLVTDLLVENLRPQGYHVIAARPIWRALIARPPIAATVLLGDVRTPNDPHAAILAALRAACAEPIPPVVVRGYGPPRDHAVGAEVTWVDAGAPIARLLDAIRAHVPAAPDLADKAAQPAPRLRRLGERRR